MNIQKPKSKQPLPSDAKKVFEGIVFDVYQWEQEQFDGTKKTFEKLKRQDTVIVIPVTEDNKIVMTEEEQPGKPVFLSLPGGRMEEGEDIEQAASRELLEETGYQEQSFNLFNAIQPISKIEWSVYTLVGKSCKKVAEQNLDSGEKIKIKFVTFDEFIELVLREDFQDFEIAMKVMRAKIFPEQMEELKKLILG